MVDKLSITQYNVIKIEQYSTGEPMKSILFDKICKNDIVPQKIFDSPELKELTELYEKAYTAAAEKIGAKNISFLTALLNAQCNYMCAESDHFFGEGIKTGFRLCLEIMKDSD